jgi:hypothetical protein
MLPPNQWPATQAPCRLKAVASLQARIAYVFAFFQFTAPENDFKAFQLDPANPLAGRTGYLEQEWKDPHIDSPGQPPDYL